MVEEARPRSRSKVQEREHKALILRQNGKSFDDIAHELGFANKGSAYKAYQRALGRGRVEGATLTDQRELELARLDALQSAIAKAANRGDLTAVHRTLQIMTLRDKLLGLSVAARGVASPNAGGKDDDGDKSDTVVGPDKLDQLREKRARDAAERSAGS